VEALFSVQKGEMEMNKKSDRAGIRTQDPRLKRPLLYRLSYSISVSFLRPQRYNQNIFNQLNAKEFAILIG
jgi:hypothetical protein